MDPKVIPISEDAPTIKDVFLVVNECKKALGELCDQMKGVKEELVSVRQELRKTNERISEAEGRISQMEDEMHPLKQDVKHMRSQVDILEDKMDEIENRLRRDNVRLVGLPERCEGARPIEFLENWFVKLFGKESFSQAFTIERAHRVPFKPPPTGGRPRSMLLKFLNYRDKESLLRKSREMGEVFFEGSKVSFYPDFSPQLQKRRAGFLEVKRKMQRAKLPYALLYPARLRVAALGMTLFFDKPEDAALWMETQLKEGGGS